MDHKASSKFPDLTQSIVSDLATMLGKYNPLTSPELYLNEKVPCTMGGTADSFKHDYLFAEFMSKYDSFDLNLDTADIAMKSFFANEQRCLETNMRILSYERGISFDPFLETVIHTARVKIRKVLGDLHWECLSKHFAMSSGASVYLARGISTPCAKLTRPEVTKRCYELWSMITSELAIANVGCIVEHSKVTTVPKNSKTDRVICIEPSGNLLIQKAVGSYISSRLCKLPMVNLHDQSVNARRALAASASGVEATVDFSAASDTISIRTCELLLPPDWFRLLNMIRCHRTEINGEIITLQKFSSMGNGFTFELETLIFWAIAQSVEDLLGTHTLVSQYGDDLICSTMAVEHLMSVFGFFGFTINPKKSYSTGRFRESCGTHGFDGYDVSPFYIRRPIASPTELMLFLNNFRKWSGSDLMLDPRHESIYYKYLQYLPSSVRNTRVPEHLSTIGLIGPLSEHAYGCNSSKIEVYAYFVRRGRPRVSNWVDPRLERDLMLYQYERRSLLGLDTLPTVRLDKPRDAGYRLSKRWVWL